MKTGYEIKAKFAFLLFPYDPVSLNFLSEFFWYIERVLLMVVENVWRLFRRSFEVSNSTQILGVYVQLISGGFIVILIRGWLRIVILGMIIHQNISISLILFIASASAFWWLLLLICGEISLSSHEKLSWISFPVILCPLGISSNIRFNLLALALFLEDRMLV